MFIYRPLRLLCCWTESLPYPQQGLFVLAVFHFCRRQVDDGPLHAVPLAAVQIDVGPAYHNVTLHPATGVGFQEVQITFLGHNRARNKHIMNLRQNEWDFSQNLLPLRRETDLGFGIGRFLTWHGFLVCLEQMCILWEPSSCPQGWMGPDRASKLQKRVQWVYKQQMSQIKFSIK